MVLVLVLVVAKRQVVGDNEDPFWCLGRRLLAMYVLTMKFCVELTCTVEAMNARVSVSSTSDAERSGTF